MPLQKNCKISIKRLFVFYFGFSFLFAGIESPEALFTTLLGNDGYIALISMYIGYSINIIFIVPVLVKKIGSRMSVIIGSFVLLSIPISLIEVKIWLVWLTMFIAGHGVAILYTASNTYIVQISSEKSVVTIGGLFNFFLIVGTILGNCLLLVLFDLNVSNRNLFIILSLVGFFGFLLICTIPKIKKCPKKKKSSKRNSQIESFDEKEERKEIETMEESEFSGFSEESTGFDQQFYWINQNNLILNQINDFKNYTNFFKNKEFLNVMDETELEEIYYDYHLKNDGSLSNNINNNINNKNDNNNNNNNNTLDENEPNYTSEIGTDNKQKKKIKITNKHKTKSKHQTKNKEIEKEKENYFKKLQCTLSFLTKKVALFLATITVLEGLSLGLINGFLPTLIETDYIPLCVLVAATSKILASFGLAKLANMKGNLVIYFCTVISGMLGSCILIIASKLSLTIALISYFLLGFSIAGFSLLIFPLTLVYYPDEIVDCIALFKLFRGVSIGVGLIYMSYLSTKANFALLLFLQIVSIYSVLYLHFRIKSVNSIYLKMKKIKKYVLDKESNIPLDTKSLPRLKKNSLKMDSSGDENKSILKDQQKIEK
ncbi:et translation product-related [Anaeramoeba flamelloides]|uniref:Et translation product-related n=1 Tax=Anaeramoeba flamelloides TaxID=1746091 RepID=A0ABQ8X5H6_9EUKA|nr:et translation product-related [Anaeramoeba flamelloides]